MNKEIIKFNGWENNLRLSNDEVEVIITLDVGPRIIKYSFIGEQNVFKEFPNQFGTTGEDGWVMRGGHRFWIAPETNGITTEPDNELVQWEDCGDYVRVIQKKGVKSSIQKILEVKIKGNNEVEIKHILKNLKDEEFECAAWPISVMPPSGQVILPLPSRREFGQQDSLEPDRIFVLWPYTNPNDYRIKWGEKYIIVNQDPNADSRIKLGALHTSGWVGYLLDGYLFSKKISYTKGAQYPDMNCNFEMFVGLGATEIESLGQIQKLKPNDELCHIEKWSLYRNINRVSNENEIINTFPKDFIIL